MKTGLIVICSFVSLIYGVIYPGCEFPKPDMRVGEVVFCPVNDDALQDITSFARQRGGRVWRTMRILKIYVMTFEPVVPKQRLDELAKSDIESFWVEYECCREQVLSVVQALKKQNLVQFAAPNFLYYIADYIPNDPYFRDDGNYLPGVGEDQYGFFIANAPAGWDISTGDPDVLLCIIDSGVDVDHPDLQANIWINPGEDLDADGEPYDYDDLNGIDDDGNGYVDDLFGYDFVGGNVGGMLDDPSEEDWNPDIHYYGDDGWGEPDPSCGNGIAESILSPADIGVGHGTHCAGIAGAVMDNENMFAGAAGHISIVPVRIINPEGSGNSYDIAAGIEYAAIIGADVASMSFGGTTDPAIESACSLAYANDVALIAASGNNGTGTVFAPASLPITLAVGSFNADRERSFFSNYGSELDVLASGGDAITSGWDAEITEVVWSTMVISVAGAETTSFSPGDHTKAGEIGTSMACPQAAGLAALIKSVNETLSPDSVYAIIRNTAQDVGTPGWDSETGYGIIDFGAAMEAATEAVVETERPSEVSLRVRPNPANPTADVEIVLERAQFATVEILNVTGRVICVLYDGYCPTGTNQFTIPDNLVSGTYTLRFAGDSVKLLKFSVIK